jgi:acetate kinase
VVFDTAFHATIPSYAYLYPLPYSLYKRYKIRRYGFHGTSHKFVALRAAQLMQTEISSLKMITCHLGNGASMTAINQGKSVDTSMGFTPLEGLMMGTRCGDIDPAILPFLIGKENLSFREIDSLLNRHSGLLGVSGLSSDMRDLLEAASEGNKQAQVALEMYRYRIQKYIGAYTTAMNGVDVIVFTAGIGENNVELRKSLCAHLTCLGVELDAERNNVRGQEQEITTPASKVKVWVIPTNEELMIARETMECCGTI